MKISQRKKEINEIRTLALKIKKLEKQKRKIEEKLFKVNSKREKIFSQKNCLCFFLGYKWNPTCFNEETYKHIFYNFELKEIFDKKSWTDGVNLRSIAINISDLFNSEDLTQKNDCNENFNRKKEIIEKIMCKIYDTNKITSNEQLHRILNNLFNHFREDKEFMEEYLSDSKRVLK